MRDYVEYLDKISSGINDIENTTNVSDSDAIYTLQGIRSNENKPGLYIIRNRKVEEINDFKVV